MSSRRWISVVALSAILGAAQANAADGFYLGAGAGAATLRESFSTDKFDSDDIAYKGFIGWRFGRVPVVDLAVEAAYTNFGKPSQTLTSPSGASRQNTEYKLYGPSVAGLLILPLGPVDLYGKGGVIDWKAERTVNGAGMTRSGGTDAFYGGGIGLRLGALGFRAEYERFELKDIDRVEMVTLSVVFQF